MLYLVFSVLSVFFLGLAQGVIPTNFSTKAPQALLIDLSTNTILYEKNAHKKMAPSSMTKILTVYLILEALERQELTLDQEVSVSVAATKKEGSTMVLYPRQKVSIDQLLKGIIVCSGNDASTQIAEFFAGSEEGFAEMMNEKAAQLGAKNSQFANASGLPDKNHWSTCYDLALFARKTLENFPRYYQKYYAIPTFTFNKQKQFSRNKLLKGGFADGMKTGFTKAGGYGIVLSSKRGNRRLLLVINGMGSEQERIQEARRIMDWGFNFFRPIHLFKKNEPVSSIHIWPFGSRSLCALEDICISIPKRFFSQARIEVQYFSPLKPPIKSCQKLGTLSIQWPNNRSNNQPHAQSTYEEKFYLGLKDNETIPKVTFWQWLKTFFQPGQ